MSDILNLIEGLRQTGENLYRGFCPVRKHSSGKTLDIKLERDRTLIHCKGGCSTEDVLNSLGLEYSALFLDGQKNGGPHKNPFNKKQFMRDYVICQLWHSDRKKNKPVNPDDEQTFMDAARRIKKLPLHPDEKYQELITQEKQQADLNHAHREWQSKTQGEKYGSSSI